MDASTRASLLRRISQYFPEGSVIPERWEEIPLTTRLVIETQVLVAAAQAGLEQEPAEPLPVSIHAVEAAKELIPAAPT